jgi:hypothetical protein
MNTAIRAIVAAATLLPAWLMPAPSRAEECRIGPVTVEAPVCTVNEAPEREGPAQFAEWREGGMIYIVAVIASKRSDPIRGYFARWRQQRKCTANEIRLGHEVRFESPASAGKPRTPPQTTWTGACISSASGYITHAIGLRRQVVELHVNRTRGETASLEAALAAFLDRVHLSPGDH